MRKTSRPYVDFLIKNRIAVILLFILTTGFFAYQLTKIRVDNDTMKSVPADLKEKISFIRLQETFSEPFTLLFLARFQSGDIISKIDSITAWGNRFAEIESDGQPGITDVINCATLQLPKKGGFLGIKGAYVLPKGKEATKESIQQAIEYNKDYLKTFISEDQSVFGMVLSINSEANRSDVIGKAVAIVEEIKKLDKIESYITGATASSFFLDRIMKKDFSILLPLGLIVAFLLLYFIFRNILYVIFPLVIIAIAIVWTFGLMSVFGIPFSVVTSVIPVILFPIGVADSIHLLKTYARLRSEDRLNLTDSLTEAYDELFRPVLLTSITTFIGFGSFSFSAISWTRHFGVFTSIGVMFALFFTLILLPVFLSFEYETENKKTKKPKVPSAFSDSFLARFNSMVLNTSAWKIFLALVIILCVWGSLQVRFESNPIGLFSKKSSVRKSDEIIGEYFGGTRFFSIVLTRKDSSLIDTLPWMEIEQICQFISDQEAVGKTSSLLPLVKRTSTILSDRDYSSTGISMLLGGKNILGRKFSSLINNWVTEDRKSTKISVTCKNIPGYKYTALADSIETYITSEYPSWEVLTAGPALLIDAMISLIVKTQISSLLIAFSSVFVILSFLFSSIKTGFYTSLPIIISTIFIYALMGIFGVTINMVTVIIVNTCIGIGIDYAIHFTAGYLYERRKVHDPTTAILQTVKNKGTVIIFNTIVVGAGFFVLVFSSFPPIKHFGGFIFISMLTSTLFSLIFLPVFFHLDNSVKDKSE